MLPVVLAPLVGAQSLPDDPRIAEQSYLFSDSGGVGAPEAWALADERGELAEVVVALIDSGIRSGHEDLRNRLWVNAGEIPGNGIDDDGNGYIDDVHDPLPERLERLRTLWLLHPGRDFRQAVVAGILALLKGVYLDDDPDMITTRLMDIL